jgi:hypothetical protein
LGGDDRDDEAGWSNDASPAATHQQSHNKQNQKDEKQHFCDSDGRTGDPREPEKSRYQTEDEKYDCVMQHR